jgi:uncharacterized protein
VRNDPNPVWVMEAWCAYCDKIVRRPAQSAPIGGKPISLDNDIGAAVSSWAIGEPLVRRVYLFGSRAKGTARPDSDIDLAILHEIDPEVAASCDPSVAHWMTWWVHEKRWSDGVQERLVHRAHVQPIDRDSRHIVIPALKQCRVCLYRRML